MGKSSIVEREKDIGEENLTRASPGSQENGYHY